MTDSKPVSTPFDYSNKLCNAINDNDLIDQKLYQAAVGSLLYLSTRTRPDITFAVNTVARYSSKPNKQHFVAVKRIFRYLKGTINLGLAYNKSANKNYCLIGYSDADWASNIDDRKSISGYVFMLGNTAISWNSKRQNCVALSSCESEYIALSLACQEAIWINNLMNNLYLINQKCVTIYEDNQSCLFIVYCL